MLEYLPDKFRRTADTLAADHLLKKRGEWDRFPPRGAVYIIPPYSRQFYFTIHHIMPWYTNHCVVYNEKGEWNQWKLLG